MEVKMDFILNALIVFAVGFAFGVCITYGVVLILINRVVYRDEKVPLGKISNQLWNPSGKKRRRKPRVIEGGDEREYMVDVKRDEADQPEFMIKSK
jgi:hypothetical protein